MQIVKLGNSVQTSVQTATTSVYLPQLLSDMGRAKYQTYTAKLVSARSVEYVIDNHFPKGPLKGRVLPPLSSTVRQKPAVPYLPPCHNVL
jgi:hypothetical protein